MKLCHSILICDVAQNLIAINKPHLTEVQDPSLTSMYFQIVKQSGEHWTSQRAPTYFLTMFSKRLHKNEDILSSLDPPLVSHDLGQKLNLKKELKTLRPLLMAVLCRKIFSSQALFTCTDIEIWTEIQPVTVLHCVNGDWPKFRQNGCGIHSSGILVTPYVAVLKFYQSEFKINSVSVRVNKASCRIRRSFVSIEFVKKKFHISFTDKSMRQRKTDLSAQPDPSRCVWVVWRNTD